MQTEANEKKWMIQMLSEQLAIPSVKSDASASAPFGEHTRRALEHFLQIAENEGFDCERFDGYAGVVNFGPKDAPCVAAICHLDVVPAGEWEEAFLPRVEGDRLIGRGSLDDKGPAVAAYLALRRLKASNFKAQNRLQLILGLDEESGSLCMKHYREHANRLPSAAFTPDAEFPVIHAEKGMLQFEVLFKGGQKDASGLRLIGAKAGARANVIPGRCELFWETENSPSTEVVEGVMGHASLPELGQNAIALALGQADEKLAAADAQNPFVKFFCRHIGLGYDGFALGVKQSDEPSGSLTFNCGVLDYDGENARLVCDIRYPVTADGEALSAALEARITQAGGAYRRLSLSPPLYFPKDHPLVQSLLGVYRRLSGRSDEALAIGGGTYARSIPNTVAFGPTFPGDEALAHQNGECVSLAKLYESIRYYEEAFKALDALKPPLLN